MKQVSGYRLESPLLSIISFQMVVGGVHHKYVRCSVKWLIKTCYCDRRCRSTDGAMNTEYSRFSIKSAAHRSITNERRAADKDLKQINDLAFALNNGNRNRHDWLEYLKRLPVQKNHRFFSLSYDSTKETERRPLKLKPRDISPAEQTYSHFPTRWWQW